MSRKRAQLLNGLDYDRAANVLEVGCGCGAISRFLGETFDHVISIEGSPSRAALARKRCRDLDNLAVISAPFQRIQFRQRFDIIFCIGVFEYSSSFVEGDDPYAAIIDYFAESLSDNGVLVLAIENQFGLKYFASASEDHTRTRYDGVEGYQRYPHKARTFGYTELDTYLGQRFESNEYFFPFPDYKVPDGVLSERLFDYVDASPLLTGFRSRDYLKPYRARFDERLAWAEIARNQQIPFFANSFLVVASKNPDQQFVRSRDLGSIFNRSRAEDFQTRTRLFTQENASDDSIEVWLEKQGLATAHDPSANIKLRPYTEKWHSGQTLQLSILRRALAVEARFPQIFEPANVWYESLTATFPNGLVDGAKVDAIWQNCIVAEELIFIDQEWLCDKEIPLKTLLIRAVYWFLVDLRSYPSIAKCLRWRTSRSIIEQVGAKLGVQIDARDFDDFIEFESRFNSAALGRTRETSQRRIMTALRLPQQAIKLIHRAQHEVAAGLFYARKLRRLVRRIYHDYGRAR